MKFVNMTQKDFSAYKEKAIKNYAIELEHSNMVPKGMGEQAARQQLNQALPKGIDTKNFYFYYIINDKEEHVGLVIYGTRTEGEAFILDIQIDENEQGKGYGKKAITLLEKDAKSKGYKRMGLHVFGHNQRAINLYYKLDYYVTSMQMAKEL
jgi:ribosomal protein S18 acetylase RimI-like enzyme